MEKVTPPVVEKILSSLLYRKREEQWSHVPYERELLILDRVKNGDTEALKSLTMGFFPQHDEHLSEDKLRQMKYQGVASLTLISRWAVEGGLDVETAYSLSDAYIMAIDAQGRIDEVIKLLRVVSLDFAGRVKEANEKSLFSRSVVKCIEYIESNLHYPITLNALAENTDRNAAYISVLFKKEVGISIKEYVLQKRMDEAKKMLSYSETPISQISSTLAFTTQSYFARVFKEATGQTPGQYRNRFFRAHHPGIHMGD